MTSTAIEQKPQRFWCVENFSLADVLTQQERDEMHEFMQFKHYRAGETVYFPGDPNDTVYSIHEGQVRLAYLDESGKRLTLALMGQGQVFGETTLAGQDKQRWIAEAVEDSVFCIIPRDVLVRFAERNPRLALKINKLVGERQVEIENKLTSLLFKGVRERLAQTLLHLAGQYGEPTEDGTRLSIKITHQDLAYLIGSTRETTSMILGEFERNGLVNKSRERVLIQDEDGLRDRASG